MRWLDGLLLPGVIGDSPVVVFPLHQMQMHWNNISISASEGVLPSARPALLGCSGRERALPGFYTHFFHFWRSWYLIHWGASVGYNLEYLFSQQYRLNTPCTGLEGSEGIYKERLYKVYHLLLCIHKSQAQVDCNVSAA